MKYLTSLFLPLLLGGSSLFALTVSEISDITPKVDEAPVPVQTTQPKYPEALRKEGVSGLVLVTLVIDEHGAVIASEIKKSSNEAFSAPALEAIVNWKFKPAKVGDKAVKVRVNIPIRFTGTDSSK